MLEYCWRAPGIVSLFLIESKNAGTDWLIVHEAHLSGLQNYRDLLHGVSVAVPALLAAGFHRLPKSETTRNGVRQNDGPPDWHALNIRF